MYMHLGTVISDMILDIRGHTNVEENSEYHHAINGYWVVDNLGDSCSTSRVITLSYFSVNRTKLGRLCRKNAFYDKKALNQNS